MFCQLPSLMMRPCGPWKHWSTKWRAIDGAISGEHSIGTVKRPFLHLSHSPEGVAVMLDLKQLFNPVGVLNPGCGWNEKTTAKQDFGVEDKVRFGVRSELQAV